MHNTVFCWKTVFSGDHGFIFYVIFIPVSMIWPVRAIRKYIFFFLFSFCTFKQMMRSHGSKFIKEQTVKKISFPLSPLRHLIFLPRRKNISYQDFFSLALVCSLWNLSYLTQPPAVNPVPWQWKRGVLSTGPTAREFPLTDFWYILLRVKMYLRSMNWDIYSIFLKIAITAVSLNFQNSLLPWNLQNLTLGIFLFVLVRTLKF